MSPRRSRRRVCSFSSSNNNSCTSVGSIWPAPRVELSREKRDVVGDGEGGRERKIGQMSGEGGHGEVGDGGSDVGEGSADPGLDVRFLDGLGGESSGGR
jgi:hypothetical protein